MPLIFAVFVFGAVWSFREQTALARSADFHIPELLPLTFDGFAVAMAAVAWAASLDGRPAILARLGITVGIGCSVTANATYAWDRSAGDMQTVAIAVTVPVLTMVAFEVVLAEVRRQVQRKRGLPRPDPIPLPRLLAVLLSPVRTPLLWRRLVLELTDLRRQFEAVRTASADQSETAPEPPPAPARKTVAERSGTGATVTPINRSGPRRTATRTSRQTGRTGGRLTDHSPVAIQDAEALLDRYGDDVPARSRVSDDMGWGSPKAGKAIKAVPAVRAARRERSTPSSSDRSAPASDDDKEREPWAV